MIKIKNVGDFKNYLISNDIPMIYRTADVKDFNIKINKDTFGYNFTEEEIKKYNSNIIKYINFDYKYQKIHLINIRYKLCVYPNTIGIIMCNNDYSEQAYRFALLLSHYYYKKDLKVGMLDFDYFNDNDYVNTLHQREPFGIYKDLYLIYNINFYNINTEATTNFLKNFFYKKKNSSWLFIYGIDKNDVTNIEFLQNSLYMFESAIKTKVNNMLLYKPNGSKNSKNINEVTCYYDNLLSSIDYEKDKKLWNKKYKEFLERTKELL